MSKSALSIYFCGKHNSVFMKFTQSEAFKKIKGILTRGGKDLQMSERSIMEQIDSLTALIANDDMELDDFVAKVEPMFKTMNGNAKKDYSDFVNKWKEEHPDTDPANKKEGDGDAGNADLAALRAEMAALKESLMQSQKDTKIAGIRTSLRAKVEEKGVKNSKWLDKVLAKYPLSDDTDIETEADEILEQYNLIQAEMPANVTPGKSTSAGAQEFDSVKQASEMAKRAHDALAALSNNKETE